MLKPVFDGKFSKSHVLGVIFGYFCDFGGVNVDFSVFDPQKALPYPKRHLPVYFMKLSNKQCRLYPGSRTQKNTAVEEVYVGCLPESDPCKCYETWHGGSRRVRNHCDRFGPHRLTGFGVSRHPSWVPAINKAHWACTAVRVRVRVNRTPNNKKR